MNNQQSHSSEVVKFNPSTDQKLSPYPNHTLIGSYVWLRPIFPDDWKKLCEILCNPEKMKYFRDGKGYLKSEVQSDVFTQASANLKLPEGDLVEVMDKKAENSKDRDIAYTWTFFTHKGLAGRIVVYVINSENRYEIGYCGSGGTEKAAKLVVEYLAGKNCLATVHPDNKASVKILNNLGFVPDQERQNVEKYGSYRDYYLLTRQNNLDRSR